MTKTVNNALLIIFACSILVACGKTKTQRWSGVAPPQLPTQRSKLLTLSPKGPLACKGDFGYYRADDDSNTTIPSLWNIAFQARLSALFYEKHQHIGDTLESWGFGDKGDGHWLSMCASDARKISRSGGLIKTATLSSCGKQFFSKYPNAKDSEFVEFSLANKNNLRGVHYFSTKHLHDKSEIRALGDTEFLWLVHHPLRVAILVFQGTTSVGDAFTDFSIAQKKLDWSETNAIKGKIHRGFLSSYKDVRDQIWMSVDTMPKDYSLWIVGHSLGGSLAMLATLDLTTNHGVTVKQMTSFGAPKVGDKTFSKSVNSFEKNHGPRLVRIRNDVRNGESVGRDLIARLPVGNRLTGIFRQSGTRISLYNDGSTSFHPSPLSKSAKRGVMKRLKNISGHVWNTIVGYRYHSMDEYERRLKAALTRPEHQGWSTCQQQTLEP